jgi:DNA gyrase/topoisomerase IV subunit A
LINPQKIEEWINEVEGRPASAALIIRYIAARLSDLSGRNEALLAENIELRAGQKIEDYESRIANLEYQLDLLRRQMGGDINGKAIFQQAPDTISFFAYTTKGQVLRVETATAGLSAGVSVARFADPPEGVGPLRLLETVPTEELLFVFDSGRTETYPATDIPAQDGMEQIAWRDAFLVEPRGGEELVNILPVARMTLYDCCVQISRRGCTKKMMKSSFESHVAKGFIGAGVKGKPDKTCNLVLCGKDDVLVLASREGFLWSLDVNQLPYTIEEVLKLSAIDYLVTGFTVPSGLVSGQKPADNTSIFILTQNGKVIHREPGWLEKPASYKSRGQAIFSQARREAGARVTVAAAVEKEDWGAALNSKGELTVHKISDLLESGSLPGDSNLDITDFVVFRFPGPSKV